mmetsp:Transcript_7356/g.25076  ORF Transcript_7356/g.25076 Transcript_7356/m.25076 type:complete len:84 (+) Transcript_7356:2619-2870(+)
MASHQEQIQLHRLAMLAALRHVVEQRHALSGFYQSLRVDAMFAWNRANHRLRRYRQKARSYLCYGLDGRQALTAHDPLRQPEK